MNEETLVKWKEDRRARKRAEERKKVLVSCLTDVAVLPISRGQCPRHQRHIFNFGELYPFALGKNRSRSCTVWFLLLLVCTSSYPIPPTTFHCSMERIIHLLCYVPVCQPIVFLEQVEAEMKKKSKGKGLSVLSGRALFDYDSTLFEVTPRRPPPPPPCALSGYSPLNRPCSLPWIVSFLYMCLFQRLGGSVYNLLAQPETSCITTFRGVRVSVSTAEAM